MIGAASGPVRVSHRSMSVSASILGVSVCLATFALALSATPASAAEACPNEAVRQESRTNPATGQPYSSGLPECRAYEMVSPPYKQGFDTKPLTGSGIGAAPDGNTAGFGSEGDFADPENYRVNIQPNNSYLSRRGASGWGASSTFAPRNFVDVPFLYGLNGDSSLDLHSVQVSCGASPTGSTGESEGSAVVCALRKPDGTWVSTPAFATVQGTAITIAGPTTYLGGSSDLSRLVIQPPATLLPSDKLPSGADVGIYELAGVGTATPELRLLNVDNENHELAINETGGQKGPLLGDRRTSPAIKGTDYHAVSENGETVFFTATPGSTETYTVYARVGSGGVSAHTVAVSNPSVGALGECEECKSSEPKSATFEGASADGSKVFFTTEQELLTEEAAPTRNLYEYDFNGPAHKKLKLLSGVQAPATESANVNGVVRTSSDASHVYFIAEGELTSAANGNGEKAETGHANLYGYDNDTVTGEVKFVARTGADVEPEEPEPGLSISKDEHRHAQTTPDGRYLVFSSPAQLKNTGDTNTKNCCAQAVYRYDFQTGELTWVSKAAPGFTPPAEGEGKDAIVAAVPGTFVGAEANANDWNRAISSDGSYIIFTTSEKLQAPDTNKAPDVYVWHEGAVGLISDGHDPEGVGREYTTGEDNTSSMSASGSDIFFSTHTRLVGQDADILRDVYDARVGGGFPAPAPEPSCAPEACQPESPPPSFGSASSSTFTGGKNLSPPLISVKPSMESKPKPLTRVQLLTKALKACKGKPKKKRVACESQARKKYAGKAKAKKAHGRGK